jgi:hypothetical protein
VTIYECKGYQPSGVVRAGEVDDWLKKRVPTITNLLWICLTPSAAWCSLLPWKAINPVSGLMLGD